MHYNDTFTKHTTDNSGSGCLLTLTQLNMATSINSYCSKSGSKSVRNQEPAATHPPEQITQPAEPDYDLVEEPENDLYCPITLEILVEPHQTDCCAGADPGKTKGGG